MSSLHDTDVSEHRADVPALTGVRAFAALWVMAYHTWLAAGRPAIGWPAAEFPWRIDPLLGAGWLGVDVFFVLSGFVLQWQVEHERSAALQPWRGATAYLRFVGRRVLRVFPAYLACLSILLPLSWLGIGRWTAPSFADTALHLVMTHNLVPAYVSTISGVFWSLPIEWHFYLVFPAGAWILSHGRAWPLVVLALTTTYLVHWLVIDRDMAWLMPWTVFRGIEFSSGMAAASLAARSRDAGSARANAIFVAGAVALAAIAYVSGRFEFAWWTGDILTFARMVALSLAIAAMLFAVAIPGAGRLGASIFGNRAAVWTGAVSYSLYLWHFAVIEFAVDHRLVPLRGDGSLGDFGRLALAVWPAAFALSALSYALVERAFLDRARWPRREEHGAGWMREPLAIVVAWMLARLAVAGVVSLAGSGPVDGQSGANAAARRTLSARPP